MICIIKRDELNEIIGWIIATDLADGARQAYAAGERDLASLLYAKDGGIDPPSGQSDLPLAGARYTALVS